MIDSVSVRAITMETHMSEPKITIDCGKGCPLWSESCPV